MLVEVVFYYPSSVFRNLKITATTIAEIRRMARDIGITIVPKITDAAATIAPNAKTDPNNPKNAKLPILTSLVNFRSSVSLSVLRLRKFKVKVLFL